MKPDSTLAKVLARFGATAPAEADSALAALQAEFDAFRAAAEADKNEVSEALTAALSAVKEVEAQRDELAAKAAALEAAAADAAAKAAEAKANARKEKITEVLGTARADAVFAATSNLSDEAFSAVLDAMSAAGEAEAKSDKFVETGASAEANASVAETESKEMQLLRAKYGAQKA